MWSIRIEARTISAPPSAIVTNRSSSRFWNCSQNIQGVPANTPITNTAQVTATEAQSPIFSNQSTVTVSGTAQLQISKTVDLTSAHEHIKSGALTAIGVTSAKRAKSAPDIPTIAEGGVAGYDGSQGFIGLFAPAGTPPAVVDASTRTGAPGNLCSSSAGFGVRSGQTTPSRQNERASVGSPKSPP